VLRVWVSGVEARCARALAALPNWLREFDSRHPLQRRKAPSPREVVGISRAERAYAAERLGLHKAAGALPREFSGLTVWGKDGSQCLTFDGEQALRRTDLAWSRAYSEDSGRTLLPVGEYSHAVILVDEAGCLWGGFDDLYGQLADSVVDLVHELFIEPSRRFDRQLRDEDRPAVGQRRRGTADVRMLVEGS